MKKITTLLILVLSVTFAQAQIVYPTIYSDGFEGGTSYDPNTGGGFPSNFLVLAQQGWEKLSTTKNANPYNNKVVGYWKDLYSTGYAAGKTYQVAVDLTAPHSGTQCLKFTIPNSAFVDVAPHDTTYTIRLRSQDGKISFNTAAGESTTKYEVSFWAKTDGANKDVIVNTQTSTAKTYLTLTSTWTHYTIERYCTGTSVTALGIDFAPAADQSDYVVYFDDLIIKQRLIPNTYAATDVTATGFTANWSPVVGATSYSVVVEKSDGATTPTWTPITGSPFTVNDANTTNYIVGSLDAGTYRYKVTATDGTVTTVASNITQVVVGSSAVKDVRVKSITRNGNFLNIDMESVLPIRVFNSVGQEILNTTSHSGMNTIEIKNKGLQIVKVGNEVFKVIL